MTVLRLFADISRLEAIRSFVAQAGRDLALDDSVIWALQLAVDEACTNVIQHAYSGRGGEVEITVERDPEGVRAIVHDWGAEFDPLSVASPDVTLPLEQRPLGGLGLFLIRQVVDRVSFQSVERRGNTLTMVKQLPRSER